MANIYVRERGTAEIVDTFDMGDPPYIQLDHFLRGLRLQMDSSYYVDRSEIPLEDDDR